MALPVLGAALGWALWRARRTGAARWWLPALTAAVAMAAVPALVVPFKALIGRPGPPGPPADETGFFPSGHTATAAVAYGAAALLLCPRPGQRLRRTVLAAVALLNVGVGVGLVRCAYHWPLDVVASWCVTGCLLWAVVRLSRSSHLSRPSRSAPASEAPGTTATTPPS
ncbi:phosphatase PAP2 family protein [Streptomyces sp. NA02950]|uniref:phosphatase PAP2 family protein n=1 Tax=Streptomyces sp. NA02950 TaxID=2742137 RepID=UPI0034CFF68A